MPEQHIRRISILDVPVDDVTESEVVAIIHGFIESGSCHQVITVNPEFIMSAQTDATVLHVLNAAALSTPDGSGILWAARYLGTPVRDRVTGVALVDLLAAAAARYGWRLFFLGSAPGVADQAASLLQQRYPQLRVAGCYAGSPGLRDEAHIRSLIEGTHTDILLVAYGHPAQELWIHRNQHVLAVPVAIGIGGTFDEITGRVAAAPLWMHRLGIKWLWRLLVQPSRFGRIFTAVVRFPIAVIRAGRSNKIHH